MVKRDLDLVYDGGGVVCIGVTLFPGLLVMLGEFRVVMLWVEGVWGNGLRGVELVLCC